MSRFKEAITHPLCTCPELTWDMATGRAEPPDLAACRARAFGGIDPHPVLDADDIRQLTKQFLSGHGSAKS